MKIKFEGHANNGRFPGEKQNGRVLGDGLEIQGKHEKNMRAIYLVAAAIQVVSECIFSYDEVMKIRILFTYRVE